MGRRVLQGFAGKGNLSERHDIDQVVEEEFPDGMSEEPNVLLVSTGLLLVFVVLHVDHDAIMAEGHGPPSLSVAPGHRENSLSRTG